MTTSLRPYGPAAWLVEHDHPAAFAAAVRAAGRPDVVEIVPAAATTLVVAGPDADRQELASWLDELAGVDLVTATAAVGDVVEIPVVYDGEDLEKVSAATGLDVEDVVARHRDATYHCAFCGFAPGFAYLTGLDRSLHLPRLETPRTRIPAGAVAIAAGYSAVYPSASPGGWHLLGRTDAELWRTDRDPPALITPGAPVRFVESR